MTRRTDSFDSRSRRGFRETVHFYMIDHKTPLGRGIDVLIILMNLLVCAIFVAGTYDLGDGSRQMLWRTELVLVAFFILEYIARLYGAYNRIDHIRNVYSIIDLVAIFPTLLELVLPWFGYSASLGVVKTIRVFAVFRIFRFLRFMAADHMFFGIIGQQLVDIVRLVTTIVIIFFISSGLFYYVESPWNPLVNNFGDSFYFTVVALSTVGFGDIVPVSPAGRGLTALMILVGIILIPMEAGRIVKGWVRTSGKVNVICPDCGLSYHDPDASHCKHCGHVLYRPPEDLGVR